MRDYGMHPKESSEMRALAKLAYVLAFIAAFLFTPAFHGSTVNWAVGYMYENYGVWMGDLGWYVWFIASALLVYFASTVILLLLLQAIQMITKFGVLSQLR
jgi:putative oxidoreductase